MAFAPEELVERLTTVLGDRATSVRHVLGQVVAYVEPDRWMEAVRVLKDDLDLDLDYFCFLSAIEWSTRVSPQQARAAIGGGPTPGGSFESRHGADGYEAPEGDVLEVVVRLASATEGHGVTLKVQIDPDRPRLPSLVPVYGGADWHERECYEMFGVEFTGHPSLRKIYLPDHFEGNPLRKSYVLGTRLVKPWPGTVDVEEMPPGEEEQATGGDGAGAAPAPPEAEAAPVAEAPAAEAAPAPPEAEAAPAPPEAEAAPAPPEAEARVAPAEAAPAAPSEAPSPTPSGDAAPAPETEESLEAESFRTGIPIAILQRSRERRATRPAPAEERPPSEERLADRAPEGAAEVVGETHLAAQGAPVVPPPAPEETAPAVSEPPGSQGADREAARTSERTAPEASEEDLEEESRRTGIPVNILRRTREARKRAAGGVGEQSTPAGPGGEGPGSAVRGGP